MSKKINFPTALTLIRMVLVVPFLILMLLGVENMTAFECPADSRCIMIDSIADDTINRYFLAALIVFIVAAVTDKIDGDYARKHNQVTDLGKFLDPLADKMLVDTAFLGLVVAEVAPVWMFVIVIWRDLAVDGMRMLLAQKQIVLAASIWGKIKTTTQMVALILLMLGLAIVNETVSIIGMWILLAATVLTIISGLEIVVKGIKRINLYA